MIGAAAGCATGTGSSAASSCHHDHHPVAHSRRSLPRSDWNRVGPRCGELTCCVASLQSLGQSCGPGCCRRSNSVRRYDGRLFGAGAALGEAKRLEVYSGL